MAVSSFRFFFLCLGCKTPVPLPHLPITSNAQFFLGHFRSPLPNSFVAQSDIDFLGAHVAPFQERLDQVRSFFCLAFKLDRLRFLSRMLCSAAFKPLKARFRSDGKTNFSIRRCETVFNLSNNSDITVFLHLAPPAERSLPPQRRRYCPSCDTVPLTLPSYSNARSARLRSRIQTPTFPTDASAFLLCL